MGKLHYYERLEGGWGERERGREGGRERTGGGERGKEGGREREQEEGEGARVGWREEREREKRKKERLWHTQESSLHHTHHYTQNDIIALCQWYLTLSSRLVGIMGAPKKWMMFGWPWTSENPAIYEKRERRKEGERGREGEWLQQ